MTIGFRAGRAVELSALGKVLRTISLNPPKAGPEYALVGAKKPREVSPWEQEAAYHCSHYGEFSRPLLADWKHTLQKTKQRAVAAANNRLKDMRRMFKIGDFVVHNFDDQVLQDYAETKARVCIKKMRGWPASNSLETAVENILDVVTHHRFDETDRLAKYLNDLKDRRAYEKNPAAMAYEETGELRAEFEKLLNDIESAEKKIPGILKRLQDQDWWRRRLRRMQNQRIEHISRNLHQIVTTRSAYCSEIGKREWQRRQAANRDMLEHTLMENDDGELYTLADLSETSVANPEIRRTELMVRIAGLEEYARKLGYVGYFFTITCPSKYHAGLKSFGQRNPKFKGYSQRQSQDYLCKLWAKFRSHAKRITKYKLEEWEFFGIRVAEPHHDGTPHWHLMLFINPCHADDVINSLRHYATEEDRHELRTKCEKTSKRKERARFDVKKIKDGINPKTGKEYSAAGYIAKYIAKNIDGEYVDVDNYGQDAKTAAKAITAWASRNSIRQFQQIGGPSVTVWRELRRLARKPEDLWTDEELALRPFVMQLEAEAQESASHAWAIYCEYYDEHGISLHKVMRTIERTVTYLDDLTGYQYTADEKQLALNAYGEPGEEIFGVVQGNVIVCSRFRTWRKVDASREKAAEVRAQRKAERAERIEARATARAAAQAESAEGAAWTGVNNCTDQKKPPPPIPILDEKQRRKAWAEHAQTIRQQLSQLQMAI